MAANQELWPEWTERDRDLFFRSVLRWVDEENLQAPPFGISSRERDRWLSEVWLREPFLAGIVSSVVEIDKNRAWTLTGPQRQVAHYYRILRHANGGKGWRFFISQQSQSFWTTDMGAVTKIEREVAGGPMQSIWAVDPTRCELQSPVSLRYYGNAKYYDWEEPIDYFRAVSMPSIRIEHNSLGFCAVSRCVMLATTMVALYRYYQERLFARMPQGLLLMRGIFEPQWRQAMESQQEELSERERKFYRGLAILFGDTSLSAELVPLASLPEGFDLRTWTDILMYGYALAFGYDPREFWPVSSGALGTATETETMAWKATGKGGQAFALPFQDGLQLQLPSTVHFEFQHRDDQGRIAEARVMQEWARAINALAAPAGPGGMEALSVEERRQLYARHDLIPQEWTEQEEPVTVSDRDAVEDVERILSLDAVRRAMVRFPQDPIVSIDSNGCSRIIYHPERYKHRSFWYPASETEATNEIDDDNIHQAQIVHEVCPLCGFGEGDKYEGHGDWVVCRGCHRAWRKEDKSNDESA